MGTYSNRSILITGCSSGIGLCVAEGLQRRGYRVFAAARRAEDVARLRGRGLESLALDLDDSRSIAGAVDEVLERTDGALYALFNNGAYGQPGAVEDLGRDVLRAQLETNLFGWLELTNRVLPTMRRRDQGRVIHNSSVLGLVALAYRGAYVASKFALEGLSDALRMELAGSGVHVSLIEPGPILSRFRQNSLRALETGIDMEASVHRDQYRAMLGRLGKEGAAVPFTLAPEAVLRRVIHALESPRPKARYYVTFPTYLFAALRRVLPSRALDSILLKVSGIGNR
ncbi:MAG: SDR family oxidoreductase [Gammaproteobacteria bacterium]|nr:SDR family oxidoreductase [Gammaproteobacteria bacterium]NIR97801.1 SDR family oxidoreductase [Gammaproteobacteria bacterium]NIT63501.1 SDR family oxidoreductase [Gammaproteobacteria bacterium]NIV20448.1 SDR family oxidoreductase [Gammaproteobacteria bacterium]NIX11030.1 SDR family oxidoreductase [Gammaproteobacteria bacterium]